jgi:adenylate cyclase
VRAWGASAATLWTALASFAVATLVSVTPAWRALERRAYDWLTPLTAVSAEDRIVVVGIDEPSFADLGQQWPWPRHVHARLVDSLHEAGAAVIAFDVVFSEPSRAPEDDARFADAIRRARTVVLAADETFDDRSHVDQKIRVEPLPALLTAGAVTGVAGVPVDPDKFVRRLPSGDATFWRSIIAVYRRQGGARSPIDVRPGDLIRYGPEASGFAYASYYQALAPREFLPPGFFKDRIVLVGLNVNASPDPSSHQADTYATPMFVWTERLMSGVEIQSHIVATALSGRSRREVGWPGALAVSGLLALVSALSMRSWHPARSGATAAALVVVIAGLSAALLRYEDRWLPALAPMLGVVLLYVGEGGRAFAREQALRRQIRRAFTHYVSPEIVDEMLAHPERLVLGGERREITVMFADLAGFTSLSERLAPEEVAKVLNRSLTEVTRTIVEQGGTVDKYMGDAIMAFWGAPLDDPDHAVHACRAAMAMQMVLARLRDELAREGRPPISMRIGINSGVAVVGNMGSETLFDYTAIGDNVNLASRLEGVNKIFGTPILLSEATAERTAGLIPLRPVDRVLVKGKTQPVDVFTIEPDRTVVELTTAAIEAHRRRDWDRAESLCKELLRSRPDDAIAHLYLERIAAFRTSPPPPGWDGALELHEK